MGQGLMAYRSWNVEGFTDSVREAARIRNGSAKTLEKLAREVKSPVRWQDAATQLEFRRKDELVAEAAPLYWAIVEATLGTFKDRCLPNGPFMPCPLDELRRLDAELARQHVPLSVTDLVLGSPRYPWIPNPESSPLVSWWNPYDLEDAQDAVRRTTARADPWLASAVETIRGWLDVVADTKPFPGYAGSKPCIVGFYY